MFAPKFCAAGVNGVAEPRKAEERKTVAGRSEANFKSRVAGKPLRAVSDAGAVAGEGISRRLASDALVTVKDCVALLTVGPGGTNDGSIEASASDRLSGRLKVLACAR